MNVRLTPPAFIKGHPDPFLDRESGGTELYLIRHGDAYPEADEAVAGGYDDQPLSALGRRQAAALAERLKGLDISAVYCSPIKRTRQTAAVVEEALGLTVRIEESLTEVALPPLRSIERPLSSEKHIAALRTYMRSMEEAVLRMGTWSDVPGCESSTRLRTRLTQAIKRIVDQEQGKRVALITHCGIINAYIATALGIERDFFFLAANTSISVIRVRGEQQLLLSINDHAHLLALNLERESEAYKRKVPTVRKT